MDEFVATYQSSPEFAWLAARRYMCRYYRELFWCAVIAIVASVVAIGAGYREWYVLTVLGIGVGILILHVLVYLRSDRAFASMSDPQVTVRVSSDAIGFETSEHNSTVAWSGITKLWQFEDVWLFFMYSGAHYVPVPADLLTEEARERIETSVRKAGGTVE